MMTFLISGGTAGWVHPYYDTIAQVQFLNERFNYNLTVPEYISEDSKWDEHHFQKHLDYAAAFGSGAVKRAMGTRRIRDRLRRKGSFAVQYELPAD